MAGSPAAWAAEEVDLLLVLSSDVSRSIDAPKFKLQRDGYAAAIVNPRVIQAIRSGALGKIAVSFVEWSGVGAQKIVIDWTVIRDEATAKDFSAQVIEAPRAFADRTSISGGIDFAMAQLARAPFQANRHTIDVSGDGTNNSGRDVTDARDEALAKGVTINGLVILSERPMSWNADHTNPPGGLDHLLPQQRDRRSRILRHGGGELQLVRPGDPQQADRRDRRKPAHAARRAALRAARTSRPRFKRSGSEAGATPALRNVDTDQGQFIKPVSIRSSERKTEHEHQESIVFGRRGDRHRGVFGRLADAAPCPAERPPSASATTTSAAW